MLKSLRLWPILQGYRGQPAANLDRLIEVIIRFSCLITDYPEIREFEINPLLVTPQDVIALDAVAFVDFRPALRCAIRTRIWRSGPTPRTIVHRARLKDGTPVTLTVGETGGRGSLARAYRQCVARIDTVPLSLAVQEEHAPNGGRILLHRLRAADRHRRRDRSRR